MSVVQVTQLLETYQERERKIALLRYELEHPAAVSPDEMIYSMSFSHGDGSSIRAPGQVSNKTLYIALNYQERSDRINRETVDEIVKQLVELERVQDRLRHYVSFLDERKENVIRLTYFEIRHRDEVAREIHTSVRTMQSIKSQALKDLADMYAYTSKLH